MRERFLRFMARARERTASFMIGRYGNDPLNNAILIASLILLLLSSFVGGLFFPLAVILLGFSYYRMFSRNIYKRRDENEKYLRIKGKIVSQFNMLKERWKQRKEYKFFTCPSCHTNLRVPRGRGKIKIVCRKCGHSFVGKS